MAFLVGTDEAGYGPNLGPLVVAGTLWQVPSGVAGEDLYDRLPGVLAPGGRKSSQARALVIGDSKKLYRPHGGLSKLECGVFAALQAVQHAPSATVPVNWRELLTGCDKTVCDDLNSIPWYAKYDRPVPVDAGTEEIESAQLALRGSLESSEIKLLAVCAKIVFPRPFNQRVRDCGSKGNALSLWTLELVAQLLEPLPNGPVLVQCDKHGGRNRYAGLLQHVFPDSLIEVREESRSRSVYRWGTPTGHREAHFIAKGERILPAALASMFAKYLRELTMMAFNEFWQQQVPQLKPTAGYPVDAKRFRRAITDRQQQLGIADLVLWREK